MSQAAPLMSARSNAVRYAIPRALAELDPHRHQVVEASAGTGKTYLIEHRVIDLLLSTDTLIEQILVVTFTEKATAELRFRVRRLLETVLAAKEHSAAVDQPHWSIDADSRRRLRDALLGFDRAAIFTIHGFCQRVLTENAFESRRLFAQTQVAAEDAFADAFKDALRQDFARDPAYRPYLEAWFRSRRTVEDLQTLLYRCASQNGRLTPAFEPDTLADALDGLAFRMPRLRDEAALEKTLRAAKMRPATARNVAQRLVIVRQLFDRWIDQREVCAFVADFDILNRQLECSNKRLIHYLAHYLDDDAIMARARELEPARAVVRALERAMPSLAAAVAQVFLPVVSARLDDGKSRRGQFDFADMLRLVWDSMEGAGGAELIERLRARYHYALIDEFQDTDDLQWKIFRTLYLDADDRAHAIDRSPVPLPGRIGGNAAAAGEPARPENRLCIIGDPKQAIYSFRGADVYTYLQARRQVREHGGQVTNLVDNYRSTDPLVRAYNLIFEERFGMSFFSGDIRYDHPVRAATDVRAIDAAGREIVPVRVFHVVPPRALEPGEKPGKLTAERVRQALLARMTAEIRRLLYDPEGGLRVGAPGREEPVRAGDIFVLTRTTAESTDVAEKLRQAGLPCAIYKQEGLFQTREAREVRDLLAGIADPHDRSARLLAMNTRFFGFTLSDLPHVASLPESHAAFARLFEWTAMADKMAYEELFANIVDQSGIIERALFLETSERSLTNFLHIFELLLEEVTRSRCELSELIQRLGRWMDESTVSQADERNIQRLESEESAVQIMTIHRSKGLEAKVVFLYGGFSSGGGDPVRVYHGPDGERLVHVGPANAEVAHAVKSENQSEDQRLLYVAITRAAARLYLPHIDAADYGRLNGCYQQLERRLEVIVKQAHAGMPDLCALFSVEQVSSDAQAIAAMRAKNTRIDDWEPPTALLEAAPAEGDYQASCAERAGFVVTSYTSMKKLGGSRVPLAAIDFKADIAETGARLPDEELPGGAQSGVFLHHVLEYVPFASAAGDISFSEWRALPEIDRLFRHAMLRYNRDPRHLEYSQRAVYHCLTTPIGLGQKTLPRLAACRRVMREVEFLYPIPTSESARAQLELLAERDSIRLERGYVKGFIDLVFEFQGRVYLLDWKSDILPSYSGKVMSAHVFHEYQVQAELYAVALSRMLGIDSESMHRRRFGGLVFCFIRGIGQGAIVDGKQPGVYYIRHAASRIRELEAALEARDDYR